VHLGLVDRKLDKVDGAQAAFERAASLNPRNANAHFMLGLIYEKKRQTARALAAWEACRAAASDGKMREIADKHIGLLRQP
jgi:cytochrome c-type biogenesis protein CcmH/NrfG